MARSRVLELSAPISWIKRGVADFRSAPAISLLYGSALTAMLMSLTLSAFYLNNMVLLISLLCVFVFLTPILCVGLYAISAQLEREQSPSLVRSLKASFQHCLSNEMVFALVTLVIILVWARSNTMASVFIPTSINEGLVSQYFLILIAIGVLFSGLTFMVGMYSLPMIMHREVDAITAILSSINAVWNNKLVLMIWATVLVVSILLGLLSRGLLLIPLFPIIGYSVWHAYLHTIDSHEFPRHQRGITSVPSNRKK